MCAVAVRRSSRGATTASHGLAHDRGCRDPMIAQAWRPDWEHASAIAPGARSGGRDTRVEPIRGRVRTRRHGRVTVALEMVRPRRRSAMKVRDGRVFKKNNWRLDPGDYPALRQDEIGSTASGLPMAPGT